MDLLRTKPEGPLRDFDVLYLPYCDGSLFAGDRAVDENGDGTPELFVAHTDGLYLPEAAALRLLRVRGREVETLWRHPRGRWVTEPHPLAPTHTTIVARGTDDVVTLA